MAGHTCNPSTGEPKAGAESKIEVSLSYQVKLCPSPNTHQNKTNTVPPGNLSWEAKTSTPIGPKDQVGGYYILVTAEIRVVQTPKPSSITPLDRKFCSHNP